MTFSTARPSMRCTSSGVSTLRVPKLAGRSIGVMVTLVQVPSRSGTPQDIRAGLNAGAALVVALAGASAAISGAAAARDMALARRAAVNRVLVVIRVSLPTGT